MIISQASSYLAFSRALQKVNNFEIFEICVFLSYVTVRVTHHGYYNYCENILYCESLETVL